MNGDTKLEAFQQKIAETKLTEAANQKALSTPMPGALATAFAPVQDIEIHGYKVRPLYDLDFEILQSLKHPLAGMVLANEEYGNKLADLRGQKAWTAIWLLTRSLDDAEMAWVKGEIESLARKEFGRKQLGELTELMKAVFVQFAAYFSTVVGFESATEEKSDTPQKKSA